MGPFPLPLLPPPPLQAKDDSFIHRCSVLSRDGGTLVVCPLTRRRYLGGVHANACSTADAVVQVDNAAPLKLVLSAFVKWVEGLQEKHGFVMATSMNQNKPIPPPLHGNAKKPTGQPAPATHTPSTTPPSTAAGKAAASGTGAGAGAAGRAPSTLTATTLPRRQFEVPPNLHRCNEKACATTHAAATNYWKCASCLKRAKLSSLAVTLRSDDEQRANARLRLGGVQRIAPHATIKDRTKEFVALGGKVITVFDHKQPLPQKEPQQPKQHRNLKAKSAHHSKPSSRSSSSSSSKAVCLMATWTDWDLSLCLPGDVRLKQLQRKCPEWLSRWMDIKAMYRMHYDRNPTSLVNGLEQQGQLRPQMQSWLWLWLWL